MEFPQAANIKEHFYDVDDCLTGADSMEEAMIIRKDLNELLDMACMRLRMWRSSSTNLLQTIPEEL